MSKIGRYTAVGLAVIAAGAISSGTRAAEGSPGGFPAKPIKIVIGGAPGGGNDIIARMVTRQFSERWGRGATVESRSGGAGTIAMNAVAKAPADGYTLFLGGGLVRATVLKVIPFDMRDTFAPIAQLTSQPYIFAVNANLPAASFKEFVAYARSRPGKLSYGSAGVGSLGHMGMELLKSLVGIDMVHIPYKGGGPAMLDLVSGQIQVLMASGVSVGPHLKSGKLRALGVTNRQRIPSQPDLPTLAEAGVPGYELNNAYGLFAPAGTPLPVIEALNAECNELLKSAEFRDKLAVEDADPAPANTHAQFRASLEQDFSRWNRFFKTTGLSVEKFR